MELICARPSNGFVSLGGFHKIVSNATVSKPMRWRAAKNPHFSYRVAVTMDKSRIRLQRLRCCSASAAGDSTGRDTDKDRDGDSYYMRMCVSLARKALGCTSPNPMVGCVIVKDGTIVGQGFHPKAGEPHAEVFALREAGEKAEGATAYVSLEPCNHYGRTPPCTQALIKARVGRVVMGMVDPNPIVASKGIEVLKNSGIEVTVGVEEQLCKSLNEVYIHHIQTSNPFVTLRYSMSLDGRILDGLGDGAVEQGGYYSKLLQEYDGVIISASALNDDPALLSSESRAKQPLRIVVTRSLDIPLDLQIFNTTKGKTLVITDEVAVVDDDVKKVGNRRKMLLMQKGVEVVVLKTLDLNSIIEVCSQYGMCSVLLDMKCAPTIDFMERRLLKEAVQKVVIALCPVMSGTKQSVLSFDMSPNILNKWKIESSRHVAVIEGYL